MGIGGNAPVTTDMQDAEHDTEDGEMKEEKREKKEDRQAAQVNSDDNPFRMLTQIYHSMMAKFYHRLITFIAFNEVLLTPNQAWSRRQLGLVMDVMMVMLEPLSVCILVELSVKLLVHQ